VLPKHVLDAGVDIGVPENIVGSGPFKVEKYEKDVSYQLVRNPDYFKARRPYIDGMTRFIISDRGTIIAGFKTGRLLMCGDLTCSLSLDEATKLEKDMRGRVVLQFHGPAGMRGLNINWTKPPFDDVRVRRALHLALYRQEVVDILSGGVNLIGGPFSPGTWFGRTEDELAQLPGYRELDGDKHPDDIAEARRLVAEAGYGPNNPIKTTLKTYAVLDYADAMQIVGEQLEEYLGAEVDLRPLEVGALFEQIGQGDYELAVMGQGVLILDPTSLFNGLYRENAGNNQRHWKSDEIERLYQEHLKTSDQEKRAALVREAADYLINEDAAWVGIDWPRRPYLYHSSIKNIHMPGGIIDDLMWEHIWCEPSCGG
jgi:ABC-type transport system substrate-binding protein